LQPFLKQSKDFPFNFMDLGLNGKLALVTGSTTGIGAAIAEGLARESARVIVNGRTKYRVQKAIVAIKTRVKDAAVEGFAGDLSTAAAAEALDRFAAPERCRASDNKKFEIVVPLRDNVLKTSCCKRGFQG
jgi:NAD(P)-dependent dehydrogenase (short-subunit alcohol dehydrogenase family)